MTTVVRPDLVPNHHVDVTCPPNQDAGCVCGHPLADHLVDWPTVAAGTDAECPDGGTFRLAGGEDLDCPRAAPCSVCDVDLCDEHSSEFTHVGATGHTHHRDCVWACGDCRGHLDSLVEAGWSL